MCLLGTAAFGQTLPAAATLHVSSTARQWIAETVQRIDAQRLCYEARQLELHVSAFIQSTDNGHPIRLQVKQGVPTATEPKWPTVPRGALPKVGVTELKPGTLQQQMQSLR